MGGNFSTQLAAPYPGSKKTHFIVRGSVPFAFLFAPFLFVALVFHPRRCPDTAQGRFNHTLLFCLVKVTAECKSQINAAGVLNNILGQAKLSSIHIPLGVHFRLLQITVTTECYATTRVHYVWTREEHMSCLQLQQLRSRFLFALSQFEISVFYLECCVPFTSTRIPLGQTPEKSESNKILAKFSALLHSPCLAESPD